MATYPVLEHRVGRAGRWLREHRIRLALLIAIVETLLVVTNQLGWFWVLGIAAVVLVAWWAARRYTRNTVVRQAASTLALSQAIPLVASLAVGILVTVVAAVTTIAVVVLLAAALLTLAALFRGRR